MSEPLVWLLILGVAGVGWARVYYDIHRIVLQRGESDA